MTRKFSRSMQVEDIPFGESYDAATGRLVLKNPTRIPKEVFTFAEEHVVKILDAPGGKTRGRMAELPDDMGRLRALEIFFAANQSFTQFPPQLAACEKLRIAGFKFNLIETYGRHALPETMEWVIATGNRLTLRGIDKSIGNLTRLRKVALSGNPDLTNVPEALQNCRAIELLRVSACGLKGSAADWVFELPRLAYFSDGITARRRQSLMRNAPPSISKHRLEICGRAAGSPTSNVYRAIDRETGEQVGAKFYESEKNSDGWSIDDILISIYAGRHPRIIGGLFPIRLPAKAKFKYGLAVTPLLPEEYKPVALVPNFETVARDAFPPGKIFTPDYVINVACGSIEGSHYLVERGLFSGDDFLHNVLGNEYGDVRNNDFGAAVVHDAPKERKHRARLEIRAQGYKIDDLLGRCPFQDTRLDILCQLKGECTNEDIAARPSFPEICERLCALRQIDADPILKMA